ncbi:MAG: class I tRNA ligase family protein, partial [Bdellovibrionales bacterium]|nr:class I tRNA ligase family protein [Bdellovibrionales bacterium]
VFLRLFAPVLPYITEEVWSCAFAENDKSIHHASWPKSEDIFSLLSTSDSDIAKQRQLLEIGKQVMGEIRSVKTLSQKSLKWPVVDICITGTSAFCEGAKEIESDIRGASNFIGQEIVYSPSDDKESRVEVELAAENKG